MVSMKIIIAALFFSSAAAMRSQARARDAVSPIQKVIQLLGDMQSKRIKEGEVEQGQFEQFSRWCERTAIEKQNTIADFKEQITSLTATLDTANSNLEELSATIEDLSNAISSNEEQLKESTALREKEHKDFLKEDGDLASTIDMLGRAHAVIKKHMSSPNAVTMLQGSMQKVLTGLRSIVDASFVNVEDRKVLMALMQQSASEGQMESETEDDESLDLQPQAVTKASEAKSAPILDTIENMKEKAEASREELQKAEMKTQHSFELLRMSLIDETESLKKQMDDAKKKKNFNAEVKATSSGKLEVAKKDLATDEKYLADLQKECMEKADAFEASQAERAAELKVLMMAKKILVNAGKGSLLQQDSDDSTPSFLQVSSKSRSKALSKLQQQNQIQAADYLIRQGDRLNSWVLSQVGSHIQSDPFEKVKGMIQQMIEKLIEEQAEEAEHKAWCDAEMLKTTKAKKSKLAKVDELDTRIEKGSALIDKLKEQIKMLAKELSEMDEADKQAMEMRQAENTEFLKKKEELDGALKAVTSAIKVLRDYYSGKSLVQTSNTASNTDSQDMSALMQEREQSHEAQPAGSAAASVIGLLEVAESDFTKALEEAQAAEDAAQAEYDTMVQDNKVSRAEKMTDQKNMKAEVQRLENMIAELKLDHKDASDELNAILEYLDKLKGSCETKAPSFEERQKRRKQEMDGLQNALAILEGKAIALLDTGDTGSDGSDGFSASAGTDTGLTSMLLRR